MLAHGEGSKGAAAGAGATIPFCRFGVLGQLARIISLNPPAFLEVTGSWESYQVLEQLRDSGVEDEVRSEGKEILIIPELGNLYALSGLTAA